MKKKESKKWLEQKQIKGFKAEDRAEYVLPGLL